MEISENVMEELRKKGFLVVKAYFDLYGESEEGLKALTTSFLAQLPREEGVVFSLGEFSLDKEGDYLTSLVEVAIAFKRPLDAIKLFLKFNPASVEVLFPEKLEISFGELEEIIMEASNFSFLLKQKIEESDPARAVISRYALKKHIELGRKLLKGGG